MADREVVHVAVAPPANPDAGLVASVATVINKSPYDTRLLLAGKIPKIIAHYPSLETAQAIVQTLRGLGLMAIACKDSEICQSLPGFRTHTLEFRDKEVIFRDIAGSEKSIKENSVFLILEVITETAIEKMQPVETKKLSLTKTLFAGGVPMWQKVNEKTTAQPIQTEHFIRLYDQKSPNPVVQLYQDEMNYLFLGTNRDVSSRKNFSAVILKIRELFFQAIFDDKLAKPFATTAYSNQAWKDVETNCRLIFWFHSLSNGLDPPMISERGRSVSLFCGNPGFLYRGGNDATNQ